jgi:integrase
LSVVGQRGQSVAAYLDGDDEFLPATPRPSFGACQVTTCERWAHRGEPALCEWHERAWREDGRLTGASFEEWRIRAPGVDIGSPRAVLRGLRWRPQLELLYGLQCAAEAERRTPIDNVQRAAQLLRSQDTPSIVELPDEFVRRLPLLAFARDRVRLALTDPATEAAGDDWDLRVFGRPRGRLHFGRISQPWLKEAVKCWAFERLGTLEHAALRPNVVERVVHCVAMLSESLRRHRRDRGVDPALLSRSDALAFCADLANLEAAGRFSRSTRGVWLAGVEQFLRESRDMGLTRPGRPLAGLAEDLAVHRSDRIPRRSRDDEEGRALPPMVVDQLLDPAALQLLEEVAGADVRTMVELQARVGRRTAELCQLRWGCLSFDEIIDETGQTRPAPVLVHDMPKIAVRGLPPAHRRRHRRDHPHPAGTDQSSISRHRHLTAGPVPRPPAESQRRQDLPHGELPRWFAQLAGRPRRTGRPRR